MSQTAIGTQNGNHLTILIADSSLPNRRLVTNVLHNAGFRRFRYASDGQTLLRVTGEVHPRIVITASRLPLMSGLEFTRRVRGGYNDVDRALSIIVMTNTPTVAFLEAARASGADELLACPFTESSLLERIQAVIERPRAFVNSEHYIGPCRRRRMIDEYDGDLRRASDPYHRSSEPRPPAAPDDELVRMIIDEISSRTTGLTSYNAAKLREIRSAATEAIALAEEIKDDFLGAAARSLERYLDAASGTADFDGSVVAAHIRAMQQLVMAGAPGASESRALVDGLISTVDERLASATG